ncbi:type I pullulanase [Anaerococcus hydrogenalis]|uniref:Type I pullulanase n=1 Tax=Anaerococcus hydrogenalis TaxID=33029 RepID=A0A2N6UKX6_9FIRM|nr:type I pullulanase [Anaerococcus hydrogenalis]MDK7694470.1 type I pullulanase [Anaerococcus hydrogenalis]MDK7696248.1 type I pullulanase [Anaerococcus hydrogenalis]MDK7707497.1 type I pullulanase [Anaerococcus hydrogenalis]PMC82510.1 type I pullulanase [Anaerococcus hydrogenalis]
MTYKYEEIKDIKMGANYNKNFTEFRVFAPNREKIELLISDDYRKTRKEKFSMVKKEYDIFYCKIERDLDGYFYSYLVEDMYEVTDPYSTASSINSLMSAVIDFKKTNPKGVNKSYKKNLENEAVIYELNVKDYTSNKNSGVKNRGKYLGLSEIETNFCGQSTGLSNIVDLGITHIQLMPIYDFITTFEEDEKFFDDDNYNWGYDPELYFNVEGSYSTNPYNPSRRIYELKKMTKTIHENNINVIMDVVFNHTYKTKDSNLEILAPGYYHRRNKDGNFSNGSGVGNELASERPFVRKLIIDSLKHWVLEYDIDGFRFDLMALIDIDTIKIALKELKKIKPYIMIYGEPWMGGESALPIDKQILIGSQKSNGFSVFNDSYRDAIKGDNNGYSKGYIQGNFFLKNQIETGIAGSIFYDEKRNGFADDASEVINYFNCHDNLIYYDKLKISLNHDDDINLIAKLGFAILFLSFGKPFIYEGNEFNNTKSNNSNSYNSSLSVNGVNWQDKIDNLEMFEYVKDLIKLRKKLKIFNVIKSSEIKKSLTFIENLEDHIIAYKIKNRDILVYIVINALDKDIYIDENLKNKIFEGEKDLVKIFNQKGIINERLDISEVNYLGKKSANVYIRGEKNGL